MDHRATALRQRPLPLVDADRRLALIFSAKAGCSFAAKWFFQQVGMLDAALFYSRWVHRFRVRVFYQSDGYRPEALFDDDMRLVKIVRDPYERAVSSFIHALRSRYADQALEEFLERRVDEARRFSFREFVAYLESHSLTDQRCDPHHKVQVHEVERADLLQAPLHVVKLEEAREKLNLLEKELGLKQTDLDSLARSGHHTIRVDDARPSADRRDWPPESASGRARFPATRSFYDENLLSRVRQLYREDFERYGYDMTKDPRRR